MQILESPALSDQTGQTAVAGVAHAYGATTRIRSLAIICVPISAEFGCWKKMVRLLSLALLLAACCTRSWAQQPVIASRAGAVDLKADSQQSADVGGMEWRFHTGDDPQWASPSLNVQSWQSVRFDSDWATQGVPMHAGLAWYRLTVVVPPGKDSIAILLPPIADCYQLFSNGLLVGGMGPMPPHGRQVNPLPAAYTLAAGPRATEQTITIALRVWNKSPLKGGGPNGDPALIGPAPFISNELKTQHQAKVLDRIAFAFVALVEGLLGIAVLALFWIRRQDREYLWFALSLFARMGEAVYFIYTRVHPMELVYRDTVYCCLRAFSMAAVMMFYASVLRARRSTFWHLALASALIVALIGPYEIIEPFSTGPRIDLIANVLLALLTIPPSVWMVWALLRGVARHDPAAKVLLIPALTVQTFQVAFRISRASYQLGWQSTPSELNFPLIREPFPIGLQNCVDVAFVLGVGVFLVRRFTQSRTSEERYGAEMAAAQQVQLRLVPTDLPDVAGFQLEASYFSASEVGGDFYQVVPARDGSLLVVVGDVSGKGLRAAMTGMMAIGALRSLAQRDTGPAEILARLNQQLVGAHEGGFVTCLCARITPRGEMIVANAGHLSPYLDGVELAVPSGLPLGITHEAEYEEVAAQAPPGSKLTFLSDGVVEATNPAGELLGFERTQQLSKLSAAAIAEAAQAFGQEDDITVLTIQRTADIATFSADFKSVH
jgi:hypothetical protein